MLEVRLETLLLRPYSVYMESEGSEQLVGKVAKVQERRLCFLFKGSQLLNSRCQDIHMAFIVSTCTTHINHKAM